MGDEKERTKKLSTGNYYYMFSFSMTTYNDKGKRKSKKKVIVNNNGVKDNYYCKSVIDNNQETIVKEKGNRNLDPSKQHNNLDKNIIFPIFWPFFGYINAPMISNNET